MKLALLGYGVMNRLVEASAREQGHEVTLKIASRSLTTPACETEAARNPDELIKLLRDVDAAIDFSVAEAVLTHTKACALAGVPLVVGTTGWNAQREDVQRIIDEHNGALVYGANFSIGVNLFYRVAARAAELFATIEAYAPFIEEAHHSRKKDAPSGTALKLRDILFESYEQRDVPVTSLRAGYIPGTHVVGFDSAADQITLTHAARSREGFAAGALTATQWIIGRKGVYEFSEVMDEILKGSGER
ncbi:MAG: 4-hydroxy-tetrahydrodipicolinate reductase [Pyrinomonadaceae bacterium]